MESKDKDSLIPIIKIFPTDTSDDFAQFHRPYTTFTFGQVGIAAAGVAMVPIGWLLGLYMQSLHCYADVCHDIGDSDIIRTFQVNFSVFYIWILLTIMAYLAAKKHDSWRKCLSKPCDMGGFAPGFTKGEMLFFLSAGAMMLFNVGYWSATYRYSVFSNKDGAYHWLTDTPKRIPGYFVALVTGRMLDLGLGMLLIPVARNSFLQIFFGISFQHALRFHRWMGYFVFITTTVHLIFYVWSAAADPTSTVWNHMFNIPGGSKNRDTAMALRWGKGNWGIPFGNASYLFLIPVILTSLSYVRRKHFNLFYFTHFVVFVSLFFAYLHAPSAFYYTITGLGMYMIDLMFRWKASTSSHIIRNVVREDIGYLRFDVEMNDLALRSVPGQFMFINFPEISRREWHPFSLASILSDSCSTATFIFMPSEKQNEWTAKLAAHLISRSAQIEAGRFRINLDGPFGSSGFDPASMDVVLILVGGTGLSPGVAVALAALQAGSCARLVRIVWSVGGAGSSTMSVLRGMEAFMSEEFIFASF
ncbi:uncharacterized protein SPPG_00862 [Spizellomyces punctatus DAOM BR117]|uniref:FAD-binding FR-type domain-containing protein n=1 Tax=Spizellomyces punctatus (strain DAOM BR117) TaxID=645134 RepID=A0A0L0HVR4_SPIPD|nr:uncharacterized protein SPPG_00862 [Spizellomyces punctatus DAOM BR117]KND05203.1 hypothetical protein SPPG_00862 [Spizellomyces punctatus DAOM BR117]|eukprot:XP_016613242.1 hypothetical protein SPPG_00862 [Spizellomyces punctatus DAOM BR117]